MIRENQAIRANLRIDSRESGHLSVASLCRRSLSARLPVSYRRGVAKKSSPSLSGALWCSLPRRFFGLLPTSWRRKNLGHSGLESFVNIPLSSELRAFCLRKNVLDFGPARLY